MPTVRIKRQCGGWFYIWYGHSVPVPDPEDPWEQIDWSFCLPALTPPVIPRDEDGLYAPLTEKELSLLD